MTYPQLQRRAVKLFPRTDYTDRKAVNHIRREWMKSIQVLGPNWLALQMVPRKEASHV